MGRGKSTTLDELKHLQAEYNSAAAGRKLDLLRNLEGRALPRATDVASLHEVLCFLRAYPDDARVLATVERLLAGFDRRGDLRRHRDELKDSGIAGTSITYQFYAPMARWLVRRWAERLAVEWELFENDAMVRRLLYLLAPYCELPSPAELPFSVREWVDRLKGLGETDASFLIRRLDELRQGPEMRDWLYEDLDLPVTIAPGPDTPARTRAKVPGAAITFQTGPLDRSRPDLREAARIPPEAVRTVAPGPARRLIDLAREAMVTRSRDLDVFSFGNAADVRMIELGGGLQFACIGLVPDQRFLLEAVYGFLTLKNGVPIGYVLVTPLFESAELAYNVFDPYRGAEAAYVYGRVLATAYYLFGTTAFTIDPYQLGHQNQEALGSGAWWFYQKLGFQPADRPTQQLMRSELARMKRNPRHRSSIPTLRKLASTYTFFHLGKPRRDVLGLLPLSRVGLRVTDYLAERFGSNQRQAVEVCSREAAKLLGVRSVARFTPGERRAWRRWSPLVLILPGVRRWSPANRRALVAVIRAKGAPRESDYAILFDHHPLLRPALLRLIEKKSSPAPFSSPVVRVVSRSPA